MDKKGADEIFKEFKEHSIAEFFKKNRQMLGYSGMVRSLVTVVHEYATNSLDACEEAEILPNIEVRIDAIRENAYKVSVLDNGPGIPKNFVGKALATILAGTKFHRRMQQRGQQGIGAAGCTLFSMITTGKPIYVKSKTDKGKPYSCKISIDTFRNKPVISELIELDEADNKGSYLLVEGEFGDVKYENSEHGVYEYLKRTAISNPHAQIRFVDPNGTESVFLRCVELVPNRPKEAKPHPLGLTVNDLMDLAHAGGSYRKLSVFFTETFSRFTQSKLEQLRSIVPVDLNKDPSKLSWDESASIVEAIKKIDWIAPDASHVIPIGKEQIESAMKNILTPEYINTIERKPRVFRGGFPFVVESSIAFGGMSGKKTDQGTSGTIMRFANRVPLLFDTGGCAITDAIKSIQWKRYGIDFDNQPISIFVNLSSIYVPYSGVGKESIAHEEEIIDEIRLAVMDSARGVQRYVSGKLRMGHEKSKYKTIMRYAGQLSKDLADLSGKDEKSIEKQLEKLISKHFPKAVNEEETDEGSDDETSENQSTEAEEE